MPKNKVKLAFIEKDATRRTTLAKRKMGFQKKMHELTTLCDVEACSLIYNPRDGQLEVWPDVASAQHVLSKFEKVPALEKSRKMVTQQELLRQRIEKKTERLETIRAENREKLLNLVMHDYLEGNINGLLTMNNADMRDLFAEIDKYQKQAFRKLETLNKEEASAVPPPQQTLVVENQAEVQTVQPLHSLSPPVLLPPLPNTHYMTGQFGVPGMDGDDQLPFQGERGASSTSSWYSYFGNSPAEYNLHGFDGKMSFGGSSSCTGADPNNIEDDIAVLDDNMLNSNPLGGPFFP